ncbi:MAG: TIR domain-containing protein [Cyanobacteria bacterium J06598_3]
MDKRTFGESLSHFVRSIDIVDSSTKNDVLSLIEDYLKDELDIRFFTFYVEGFINQKVGLVPTDWHRGGDTASFTIRDNEGRYQGQLPLAYDRKIALWVVSPNREKLKSCDTYIDLFSNAESIDIPQYVQRTDHEILTSIIRPIKDGSRTYGVVNFESVSYLEYSAEIAKELRKISQSISTLFLLNKAHENQKQNTRKEIEYLGKLKNDRDSLMHLSKPKIFIASPGLADKEVIAVIREVLDEYNEIIDVVFWKDISDSGLITHQILKEIRSSQYGICYLSEPAEDGANHSYQDNDNVLIEAGMLSAMSHTADFDNWIPVREQDSSPLPFDFVNTRTLMVPRLTKNNELNVEGFRVALRKSLKGWLAPAD